MSKNDIGGYACPVCDTANPVSVNYCSNCGHWLLDTVKEPRPLSKKEFKTRTKKKPNPHYMYAAIQVWVVCCLIVAMVTDSQVGFDRTLVVYFIWLAVINLGSGKVQAKQQEEAQRKQTIKAS